MTKSQHRRARDAQRILGTASQPINWHTMSYVEQDKNKKGLSLVKTEPLWNLSRRRPTFPHSYPCSIIGPARLNFRVRDGNGCDPRGMATGKFLKSSLENSELAPQMRLSLTTELANTSSTRSRTNCESQGVLVTFLNDGLRKFYD